MFILLWAIPLVALSFSVNAQSKVNIPNEKEIKKNIDKLIEPPQSPILGDFPKGVIPPKEVVKTPSRPVYVPVVANSVVIERARIRNATEFGEQHWSALYQLISKESGWQVGRVNSSSYACGLGQSLPCSKTYGYMPATHYVNGKLFIVNPDMEKELNFVFSYIRNRYGNPTNGYNFWLAHRWY